MTLTTPEQLERANRHLGEIVGDQIASIPLGQARTGIGERDPIGDLADLPLRTVAALLVLRGFDFNGSAAPYAADASYVRAATADDLPY